MPGRGRQHALLDTGREQRRGLYRRRHPEVEDFQRQVRELDVKNREATLQQILHDRVTHIPIYELAFIWGGPAGGGAAHQPDPHLRVRRGRGPRRLNHPEVPHDRVVLRDVRDLRPGELRRLVGRRGVEVLAGAPPCQGFPLAGFRSKRAKTGHRVIADDRSVGDRKALIGPRPAQRQDRPPPPPRDSLPTPPRPSIPARSLPLLSCRCVLYGRLSPPAARSSPGFTAPRSSGRCSR